MGRRGRVVLLAAALLLLHPSLLRASPSAVGNLSSVGASSVELGRVRQAQTSAFLAPGVFLLSSLFVLNNAGLVTAHPPAARVMGIIGTTFGLIAVGTISGALATTSPSSSAGVATLILPPAVALLAMGVMSAVVPRLQRPRLWMAVATASPLSLAGIIVSIPLMASGYEALTGVALFIPSLALAGISIYAAVRLGRKPKRKKTLPAPSLRKHRLVPLDPYEPAPPPPTRPTTGPTTSPASRSSARIISP